MKYAVHSFIATNFITSSLCTHIKFIYGIDLCSIILFIIYRSTKSKLSQTLKDSNKTSDQTFHSKTQELNSCIKELGGEIEAVTRSAYQANKEFNTIQYHLTASFTS